ncbi:helix-turn-helix transcriptional regulator [Plantactinospora sp. CA-290183]|uniref:helix-turn-helix transcriptional regulator n=1 Tax=Plantactinospora sp. CA-290183 TaxID=3240006 RepID=UPI003D90DD41
MADQHDVAQVLGLIAAERLGLGTAAPATGLAQAKIRRVLPAPLADRLAAVQETVGLSLRRGPDTPRPATSTLLALGEAARARRRVTIGYRSRGAEPSPRDLDPYGLVFRSGRWYVTGHDPRRGEIRTFRLDRIDSVTFGAEGFTVPVGFDPVGHVVRSLAGVPYRWEVEVLLETDLAQARRRIPPSVAELTGTADGVLLRARAEDLTGMVQMLAGLGWPFTVVRPDELRPAVTAYAARLAGFVERPPARPAGQSVAPDPLV